MTRNEIIEKVKMDYECVLVEFEVFDEAWDLFQEYKHEMNDLLDGNLHEELLEEKNVFKVGDKWVYATEWYDAEWDKKEAGGE